MNRFLLALGVFHLFTVVFKMPDPTAIFGLERPLYQEFHEGFIPPEEDPGLWIRLTDMIKNQGQKWGRQLAVGRVSYPHPLAAEKEDCLLQSLQSTQAFIQLKERVSALEQGSLRRHLEGMQKASRMADFLDHLRKAVSLNQEEHSLSEWLDELCFQYYMAEECSSYAHSLGEQLVGASDQFEGVDLSDKRVPSHLQVPSWQQKIYKKLVHLDLAPDAHLQGNYPYPNMRLWVQREEADELQPVLGIRMPSQAGRFVNDNQELEVGVFPEFLGYLRHLRRTGGRHLYVNLQNRQHPQEWKPERACCRALEELEKHFPDVVYVVTLDHNSAFYKQKEEWARELSYSDLRQELLRRVGEAEGGYFFSERVKAHFSGGIVETIGRLADEVHEEFFASAPLLEVEERHNLLDLVYTRFIEHLMVELGVSFFNIGCKNTIDRGGAGNAMFYLQLGEKRGLLQEQQFRSEVLTLGVSPSLFFKGKLPREERSGRLLSLAQRFERREARQAFPSHAPKGIVALELIRSM